MNKTDLEIWAREVFWSAYAGLTKTPAVTKFGPGGRGEAIKKILTMLPSKELRDRIIAAIAAQMSHRRMLFDKCGSMQAYLKKVEKSGNMKFYANRNGVTWLNQMGYEDEIPSIAEIKSRKEAQSNEPQCKTMGCKYPSHGQRLGLCCECITKQADPYREEKRNYLKKIGLVMGEGESLHDYAMRCKEHCFKIMPTLKF